MYIRHLQKKKQHFFLKMICLQNCKNNLRKSVSTPWNAVKQWLDIYTHTKVTTRTLVFLRTRCILRTYNVENWECLQHEPMIVRVIRMSPGMSLAVRWRFVQGSLISLSDPSTTCALPQMSDWDILSWKFTKPKMLCHLFLHTLSMR